MGKNAVVLARLHMYAVLPRLVEVAGFDEEAKKLIRQTSGVVKFSVFRTGSVELIFGAGSLEALRGTAHSTDAGLWFSTPEALNAMFQKGKFIPVPFGKPWHFGKLMTFQKLADRLEHYLGNPEKTLADSGDDPRIKEFLVRCMMYTAVYGIREVAEADPKMSWLAKGTRDGKFLMKVMPDGPQAHVIVRGGKFIPGKGSIDEPSATLEIADLDTAWQMMQGKLNLMGALGTGQIKVTGFIPLADNLGAAMDRLGTYLQ